MAKKALLMKDYDMYSKIMEATDPSVMKYAYGRNVKNFDCKGYGISINLVLYSKGIFLNLHRTMNSLNT